MKISTLRRLLIVFLSLLLSYSDGHASHIAGGEVTVAYTARNGTNTGGLFTVSMNYFRDCSGVAYPATVTVNIYNSSNNAFVKSVVLNPNAAVTLTLGDGCYTPTLCLERRIYSATNVELLDNAAGYYLVYEECCRNGATSNIISPASAGYVFYARVPNPLLGNSSPSFSALPDGYMCQGYVNTDQFTATDANGDSLVYSLVDPLASTSTGASGPLPFTAVTWNTGYYTANPLGDPGMIINPNTGTINTLPPTMGIFILAVKVEEYRNGVKIGEITREFQYQITNCTLLNVAVSPGNPICLGTTATITPSGASAGSTYVWSSGQTTSAIVVTPTATGSYNYTVTATDGPCIKVTATTLVVSPNPTASITVAGNVCAGQNNTLQASGGIAYSWSNGSPISSISVAPGTYTVWVTNAFNCTSTASGTIYPPVASSYTWTGGGATGTNNWFDSNNWGNAFGCIPNCLTDVYIPNTSNDPDIDYCIGAGCALSHYHCPSGLGPTASCKDVTIFTGTTLTFSNTNSELDICGDFIDHGVILNNGGQKGILKFIGTITQNFIRSSSASGNPLYKVILANTATPLPTLTVIDGINYKDLPISAFGDFTFQSGILITEGDKKLIINNTASNAISGHNQSRYVYGKIQRFVAANTSYDFPVGNQPVYNTAYPYQLMNIYLTALNGLTDLTVSFENPTLTNANGSGLPVNEISPYSGQYTTLLDNGGTNTGIGSSGSVGGLWTLIPNSYAAASTYSMTLYGRNYDNQGSYDHTILKRNTFCPGIWSVNGTHLSSSVAGNVVTASRTGISGFSQVAIAKTPIALPVELLYFDATCVNGRATVSWATASESNNDYFVVERSCNETLDQFIEIGVVQGSNNSNTIKYYSLPDLENTSGPCYYRLSQVDHNGLRTEYPPVTINCRESADFNFIGVIPNPASNEANVLFTTDNDNIVALTFIDIMGKELFSRKINPLIGLNKFQIDISEFGSGIYFIKLDNGKKIQVEKVIKKD